MERWRECEWKKEREGGGIEKERKGRESKGRKERFADMALEY